MNKNKKIITIIIPTRNRVSYIRKIVSVIEKFKKNIDIIIIDDFSLKYQRIELSKFTKTKKIIKLFLLNDNRGQSYACNYGLSYAKTKYVWFFDDDDYLKKETLLKFINYLKLFSVDGLLIPMRRIYKDKILNYTVPNKKDHTFDSLKNSPQKVSTSCAIFKLAKIKKIKGWDEKLFGGTDTDLFLRFSEKNKFSILKTYPVIVNFSAPDRVTNKFLRQQIAKIYFLNKHWSILTLKRRIYYIISFILCFPILNSLKSKLKIFS